MDNAILSAKGICKNFQNGRQAVLDHLDVAVCEGDFTVVMGPSGAGKSTLLYALSGMDRVGAGQVFYRGREISRLSERALAALRGRDFGFVFQQSHLVSNLTLLENAVVAGYLNRERAAPQIRERAARLFDQMKVGDARDRLPSQVSGGEAQRAAVARAVINRPGIVFADEPTGALNRRNTVEVLDLLSELHRGGQSILMVTHDPRAAIRGGRILYLEDGKIAGEMRLAPYAQEDAKAREEAVNAWLLSLAW